MAAGSRAVQARFELLRNTMAGVLINAELTVQMADGPVRDRAERALEGLRQACGALDDLERAVRLDERLAHHTTGQPDQAPHV